LIILLGLTRLGLIHMSCFNPLIYIVYLTITNTLLNNKHIIRFIVKSQMV
jgi:hypothetical protein